MLFNFSIRVIRDCELCFSFFFKNRDKIFGIASPEKRATVVGRLLTEG